jgi:hypothetical protein
MLTNVTQAMHTCCTKPQQATSNMGNEFLLFCSPASCYSAIPCLRLLSSLQTNNETNLSVSEGSNLTCEEHQPCSVGLLLFNCCKASSGLYDQEDYQDAPEPPPPNLPPPPPKLVVAPCDPLSCRLCLTAGLFSCMSRAASQFTTCPRDVCDAQPETMSLLTY